MVSHRSSESDDFASAAQDRPRSIFPCQSRVASSTPHRRSSILRCPIKSNRFLERPEIRPILDDGQSEANPAEEQRWSQRHPESAGSHQVVDPGTGRSNRTISRVPRVVMARISEILYMDGEDEQTCRAVRRFSELPGSYESPACRASSY
jgi:hypothetical protein